MRVLEFISLPPRDLQVKNSHIREVKKKVI